nr:uncharacterized protein LOC109169244 [Ipomoea batatas]
METMEFEFQRILRDLMNKWEIQAYVMASLGFQMVLVVLAPMRRWSKNNFMFLVIWSVYLLATFIATFALTLINSSDKSDDILAFWAPFLLVHLGGPHTITALAMEDNNLWRRQMLTHIVQVFSVLSVFYSFKIFQSEWRVPTAIVFAVGIVKCIERTHSLHLASLTFLRRSIRKKTRKQGQKLLVEKEYDVDLKGYEVVRKGYEGYQTFRGFIIDHTFVHDECGKDKEFFSERDEEGAFKVMEVELNFMYEAMFTKMIAVQYYWDNYLGYIFRFVSHSLLVTAAVMFFCHSKQNLRLHDIKVTYYLLGCALALEAVAFAHLIFSEWTMVKIMTSKAPSLQVKKTILGMIYAVKELITAKKRWSGKIRQYSLINHSLNRRWKHIEPILDYVSLKDSIDLCLHTTTAKVEQRLKKLVLYDIKKKEGKQSKHTAEGDEDAQNLAIILNRIILPAVEHHKNEQNYYAKFVLTLHLATEICYFFTMDDNGEEEDPNAGLCKQISEYLAFLLVMEGNITSAVPGHVGIRFKDICWEEFDHTLKDLDNTFKDADIERQEACEYLVNEYREGMHKNENINLSVLPKGVGLARDLIKCRSIYTRDVENQTSEVRINPRVLWASLSRVWVGLLVYASSHCRGDVYYLAKGGEFHTFVRLLMAHFGLRDSLRGERGFEPNDEIN